MVFGIAYEGDVQRAKTIIDDILRADPRVLRDPESAVAVLELADSS